MKIDAKVYLKGDHLGAIFEVHSEISEISEIW
jgi:hypothetical protein